MLKKKNLIKSDLYFNKHVLQNNVKTYDKEEIFQQVLYIQIILVNRSERNLTNELHTTVFLNELFMYKSPTNSCKLISEKAISNLCRESVYKN